MTYAQKIDWRRLMFVSGFAAIGCVLLAGMTPLNDGLARMHGWLLIAMSVLCVWEVFATRYEFGRSELVIHSGGTRQHIRYETIEAVEQARGLWQRLASPNNLCLLVAGHAAPSTVSLCPKDPDRFLDELSRAVPWLAVMDR
jgi:hypothetical protein